jgi:hypothetical protein
LGHTHQNSAGDLASSLSRLLQAILGPGHPAVATTLHNLALACDAEGQEDHARCLWGEARAVIPSVSDKTDGVVPLPDEQPVFAGRAPSEERS